MLIDLIVWAIVAAFVGFVIWIGISLHIQGVRDNIEFEKSLRRRSKYISTTKLSDVFGKQTKKCRDTNNDESYLYLIGLD